MVAQWLRIWKKRIQGKSQEIKAKEVPKNGKGEATPTWRGLYVSKGSQQEVKDCVDSSLFGVTGRKWGHQLGEGLRNELFLWLSSCFPALDYRCLEGKKLVISKGVLCCPPCCRHHTKMTRLNMDSDSKDLSKWSINREGNYFLFISTCLFKEFPVQKRTLRFKIIV